MNSGLFDNPNHYVLKTDFFSFFLDVFPLANRGYTYIMETSENNYKVFKEIWGFGEESFVFSLELTLCQGKNNYRPQSYVVHVGLFGAAVTEKNKESGHSVYWEKTDPTTPIHWEKQRIGSFSVLGENGSNDTHSLSVKSTGHFERKYRCH